ncbi:M20/M25/M40 family metallo-hydrolase [Phenylobacterium montanum]|uniref:Vacuolar membrane protease n=1 Tax=Phenylobacterium montanum TaxID=2823693 RepID=A0A975IWH1_9CAUL|nr:M20/M25/M40 family metallo-hydrolase [Caulobacter sp. S6]QUD90077.1 M20/M25/M40 family metallo-hydrolase [Caulobacter sp. S6]
MGRLVALAAALAVGILLFYSGARTPEPLPASASGQVFSAGRAMADIEAMAQVPHPVGSAANAAVRDRLIVRMTALGLSPRIQRAIGQRYEARRSEAFGALAPVENVIGVLPGRDRSLPALALMAHYDSVPGSPGAADDMAGVATALETVRAIEAGGTPARDVMLVITDGEEAGLLGAQAFFDESPLARRIGFVLNMEARGGGGRAAMFETGEGNGGAIDLYRKTAPRPSATSLSVFLYKQLPNDTDFTVAKAHGATGLNFAFIGREFDYHSPSSTPAALDQGSVQHMGDQVLGVARAMAFAQALPRREPDAVYGSLFGLVLVSYPQAAGWVVVGLIVLLLGFAAWRAQRREPIGWVEVARGAGLSLLVLAACALALHLTRLLTGFGFGWIEGRGLLARFAAFEVAMALAGAGAAVSVAAAAGEGRARITGAAAALLAGVACSVLGGDIAGLIEGGLVAVLALAVFGRPARLPESWLGLLLVPLAAAVALQVLAPTTAHTVAWPLLVAVLAAVVLDLGRARSLTSWAITAALAAASIAWTGELMHNLLQGLDVPELPAAPIWLASLSVWPLAWPEDGPKFRRLAPGFGIAASGLVLALGLRFTDPWSPRHPAAAEPLYVIDRDQGRAFRVSPFAPDPWARAVLAADGGLVQRHSLPTFRQPVWAALAKGAPPSSPSPLVLLHGPGGALTVRADLAPGEQLDLVLRADAPVGPVEVDGKPSPILSQPGQTAHMSWQGPLRAMAISLRPPGHGSLQVQYARYSPDWPAAASSPQARPVDVMLWDRAGATIVTGNYNVRW